MNFFSTVSSFSLSFWRDSASHQKLTSLRKFYPSKSSDILITGCFRWVISLRLVIFYRWVRRYLLFVMRYVIVVGPSVSRDQGCSEGEGRWRSPGKSRRGRRSVRRSSRRVGRRFILGPVYQLDPLDYCSCRQFNLLNIQPLSFGSGRLLISCHLTLLVWDS